ncbi:hypothetical protein ACIQU6_28015 [Streptomyces sp. NPDC090442]|uniref:hypothetical protein n=1 Tax=Streptomyces sp. NPDC090442 TaxID=3365962 RepID=UPI00381A8EDA
MATTAFAAAPPALAHPVANLLPHRDGHAWTAAPYSAWWTGRPAVRLTQIGRPGALILAENIWHSEVAWQLDDREPYEPDLTVARVGPWSVAREVLRLVLPRLDDATAAATDHRPKDAEKARLRHLGLISNAVRAHGAVPHQAAGSQPNSHRLTWEAQGVSYVVTLVGSNPACELSITGPVSEVEQVLLHFLPTPVEHTPRFPMRGIRTRLGRRLAAHLVQFTPVDQLDDDGLTFGEGTGPFGSVAAAGDPIARVRDTTPVTAELHSVGVDHLIRLAASLAR